MNTFVKRLITKNQRGVSAIIVGVSLVMLVGFAALAIDLGHLYVAKNELQNAADAGALAGAAALYEGTGGDNINPYTNEIAKNTAEKNKSEGVSVELYHWADNDCSEDGDVQRGHWFLANPDATNPDHRVTNPYFQCNAAATVPDLALYSFDELNADPNFINAVKVRARRSDIGTPILSFFAQIFGHESFELTADAVAYIGFASFDTNVDLPIAICEDSVIFEE